MDANLRYDDVEYCTVGYCYGDSVGCCKDCSRSRSFLLIEVLLPPTHRPAANAQSTSSE